MSSHSRVWQLTPAWVFFSLDVILTLAGQPTEYWAGDFSKVIETNPVALPILTYHPGLFVGLALVWDIFLGVVRWRFHGTWVTWLLTLIAFAHALGSCSWIIRATGWVGGVVYLIVASRFARWCWKRAE